jgi:hypothetical protein
VPHDNLVLRSARQLRRPDAPAWSRDPSLADRTSEQEERDAGYRVDHMTHPFRNLLAGFAIAIVMAFVLAVPSIGHVSTWKIVLALLGLALFVVGGPHRSQPS